MTCVIINSGGLGERMREFYGAGNKSTLTVNKTCPLLGQLDFFTAFLELPEVLIILNKKDSLVYRYINEIVKPLYAESTKSLLVVQSRGNLSKDLTNLSLKENVYYLCWSDIIPVLANTFMEATSELPIVGVTQETSWSPQCRYSVDASNEGTPIIIEKPGDLNVTGLFKFPDLGSLISCAQRSRRKRDFCEGLKAFDYRMVDVYDVGHPISHYNVGQLMKRHNPYLSRYNKNMIIRKVVTPLGEAIEKYHATKAFYEFEWYEFALGHSSLNLPEILDFNYSSGRIQLEFLDGLSLHKSDLKLPYVEKILDGLTELHKSSKKGVNSDDWISVTLDKPRLSFNKVERIFQDLPTLTINGLETAFDFRDLQYLVWSYISKIRDKLQPYFVPIHGDPTFSNILISDNKPYLIDPRGDYGIHSGIYGDRYYDLAKLVYSCQGYDYFNERNYQMSISGDSSTFSIPIGITHRKVQELVYSRCDLTLLEKIYVEFLAATMWASLASLQVHDLNSMRDAVIIGTYYLNQWYFDYREQLNTSL